MLEQLVKGAAELGWVDWVVTLTALAYIAGASRNKIWGWYWGMASCALWAYASYAYYQLYLDALLQLFYVGMALWAVYRWRQRGASKGELPISRVSARGHGVYIGLGAVISVPFGYFFDAYTPAAATYWDAFTTVFAVLATIMLAKRQLDNWLYWVVVDAIYVGLYYSRGAFLLALVMIVYTIMAVQGYRYWRRQWALENRLI